ncbi:hypothetical protein FRC04_005638 [Tulasnella sp. 424]|nr:hypothetical protein FRC04_005638 [Tulasnella sp. 424]KAG8962184.1 hypothetical protein FRC05_005484 [Tulasnella sp. 425]
MAATEALPDPNLSAAIPTSSTIRTQIQPSHMPSNISYDIFLIIAYLCWDRENNNQDSRFPITASHVCRTWRRYALDTGAFWTSLEFRQTNPHLAIMKYEIWLERAKDSPLDIFIGPQPFKGASVKHAKSIMRLIMPHVGHWRSFHVEHVPKKIVRLIFDRLRDVSAPRLETLKVFGERLARAFRPLSATRLKLAPFIHGEASGLKELVLEGFPYGYFLNRFPKLQVLHLTHPDFATAGAAENVKSVHHVLASLPSLRALRIDFASRIFNSPFLHGLLEASTPRISHSSLTELSIALPKVDEDMVLGSFALPKLRYFLIRRPAEATLSLSLLAPLSKYRPFPNLISLCIGTRIPYVRFSGPPEDPVKLAHLEGALAGLPQLKALTFDCVGFGGNRWLLCLTTTCPQLQWLTFIECGGCTLEPLRTIVERRRTKPGFDSLVRLVIQQWPGLEGMTIDEGSDRWLKQSLIYEVTTPVHPDQRNDYLRVVEGVEPSRD